MRMLLFVLLLGAVLNGQHIIEDIKGSKASIKVIEITESHVIYQTIGSEELTHLPRGKVKRITDLSGVIIFEGDSLRVNADGIPAVTESTIQSLTSSETGVPHQEPQSIEDSLTQIAIAHQAIATVYVIMLGIAVGSMVISLFITLSY